MAVKPLPSGTMDKILTFIEPVRVGIVGEEEITWTPRFKRPAVGGPMSGREFINALATETEITHRFQLRGDSDMQRVTTDWRIELRGRMLEIVHKLDLEERGVVVELMCKEVP